MFGYIPSISIPEIVVVALNCALLATLGLVLSIFPDQVQGYHLEQRMNPGRFGRWMARHYPFYGLETRLVGSTAYLVFLAVTGYCLLLLSGVLAGFLVALVQVV